MFSTSTLTSPSTATYAQHLTLRRTTKHCCRHNIVQSKQPIWHKPPTHNCPVIVTNKQLLPVTNKAAVTSHHHPKPSHRASARPLRAVYSFPQLLHHPLLRSQVTPPPSKSPHATTMRVCRRHTSTNNHMERYNSDSHEATQRSANTSPAPMRVCVPPAHVYRQPPTEEHGDGRG